MKTEKQTSSRQPRELRPKPLFDFPLAIKVPHHVHSSCGSEIVGREWGPDNYQSKAAGWVYYIKFPEGGMWWLASEQEITKWQEQEQVKS